ncbi:hypothetical protein BCON_0058g00350 [Botryotinia convoluta]|uniref:Uncharacterized protein n=1 Tax=Botryotinia convoluta TaxID=54673 RepID=A0A4Z1IEZ3_9HELO|nr:hypothetical protein BCON_0058g00350 [Botryotinia convoluta]
MPQRSSRPSTEKPDSRDFKHARDYREAEKSRDVRPPVLREHVYVPAIASDGQKQEKSSCPPIKKVADPVNNQGKAEVTWRVGEKREKPEVVIPKNKIVHQQTPDPRK